MKIGDKVYIKGIVDEIRNDTIIIKNKGGYFGTVRSEIVKSLEEERPKGEPIVKKADYLLYGFEVYLYECPSCLTSWKERFNFCPECGLDWRESEGEE